MSQGSLSERDVCTKLITPALRRAGWDIQGQVREEVSLTHGQVMVRGRLVARGTVKRADYVLYLKPNLSLATSSPLADHDQDQEPPCRQVVRHLEEAKDIFSKFYFTILDFNMSPGCSLDQRQGALL